jgi:hypothetical protein
MVMVMGTVMVTRGLASALRQDQHSVTTQRNKKSELAWRNRQAKSVLFARAKLKNDGLLL